jgi:hypothetical protein
VSRVEQDHRSLAVVGDVRVVEKVRFDGRHDVSAGGRRIREDQDV